MIYCCTIALVGDKVHPLVQSNVINLWRSVAVLILLLCEVLCGICFLLSSRLIYFSFALWFAALTWTCCFHSHVSCRDQWIKCYKIKSSGRETMVEREELNILFPESLVSWIICIFACSSLDIFFPFVLETSWADIRKWPTSKIKLVLVLYLSRVWM